MKPVPPVTRIMKSNRTLRQTDLDNVNQRAHTLCEHAHYNQGDGMRITNQAKAATRDRILETAAERFTQGSWETTTTRDIAAAAGIANGTLFNYFASREAIVAALIEAAMPAAAKQYRQ